MKSDIKQLITDNDKRFAMLSVLLTSSASLFAAGERVPAIGPVRFEFIIFGMILLGVALFHKQTFRVAVTGLVVLLTLKLIFDPDFCQVTGRDLHTVGFCFYPVLIP